MRQDSLEVRQHGAQDFLFYYEHACAKHETHPLRTVKLSRDRTVLDLDADRFKASDWPPILQAIAINKHLEHIGISSSHQLNYGCDTVLKKKFLKTSLKRKVPAIHTRELSFKLSRALKNCLTVSPNLKTLHLHGLELRERDLSNLTNGLSKSMSLENLSLAHCPISDEGLEIICQSVKYSGNIKTIDFTGCSITWRGAEHLAQIIKYQGMERHGTAWAESLRYRRPQFDGMKGLRRITLNCNTLIGDRGAAALAQELTDDLWIKALDLQKCGLSNEGACRLLEALKNNYFLSVLDIRFNPLVDKDLIKTVIEKVLMNGQSQEYNWIKMANKDTPRVSPVARPTSAQGQTSIKKVSQKATSPRGRSPDDAVAEAKCPCSSNGPWRTAARAGRKRRSFPRVRTSDKSIQAAGSVKFALQSSSEEEVEDDELEEEKKVDMDHKRASFTSKMQTDRLQMELKECRIRLAQERRARLKTESRLLEYELENARLRDANRSLSDALSCTRSVSTPTVFSVLEDEEVLESIEKSFNKFHAFLDLLKDAGLGQMAAMAGIDKSDFSFGRPQFSSTIGPQLRRSASKKSRNAQLHSDGASSDGDMISMFPVMGAEGSAFTHTSHARKSIDKDEDQLQDIPLDQAFAAEKLRESPFIPLPHGRRSLDKKHLHDQERLTESPEIAEEELHEYLEPHVEPDSPPESSYGSLKSYDDRSAGEIFRSRASPLDASPSSPGFYDEAGNKRILHKRSVDHSNSDRDSPYSADNSQSEKAYRGRKDSNSSLSGAEDLDEEKTYPRHGLIKFDY